VWKSLSEVDFQKLFSGAINLPGVFAIILRTFGAGPGVWGEGPVLDPLLAGISAIFLSRQPLNRLGSRLFCWTLLNVQTRFKQ